MYTGLPWKRCMTLEWPGALLRLPKGYIINPESGIVRGNKINPLWGYRTTGRSSELQRSQGTVQSLSLGQRTLSGSLFEKCHFNTCKFINYTSAEMSARPSVASVSSLLGIPSFFPLSKIGDPQKVFVSSLRVSSSEPHLTQVKDKRDLWPVL